MRLGWVSRDRDIKTRATRPHLAAMGTERSLAWAPAARLQWPQLPNRGPESFAVWFPNPVLGDLICGGAAGAEDDAFACTAADGSVHFQSEAVRRARRGGSAWLK